MKPHSIIFSTLLLLGGGCADDLREDIVSPDGSVGDQDGSVEETGNITHEENGNGTTTTVVNAADNELQIFLDLGTKQEKNPNTPDMSNGWDLSFNRFNITLNGGVSGQGGVEVLAIPGGDFDALTAAVPGDYKTDIEDGPDEGTLPDLFFADWYNYNGETHVLTPKENVYIIHSVEGDYYKMQILDYYDDAGTSGFIKFKWGPIAPPAGIQNLTIDAADSANYTYVSLRTGQLVTTLDPETDLNWDIALSRTKMRTNSGTSGAGLGGVIDMDTTDLAGITTAPSIGYDIDVLIPPSGAPGSVEESGSSVLATWFDYDQETHVVSPRATSFVLRGADGSFSKVKFTNYSSGVVSLDWMAADGATF